jgi:hypothetical protein
MAIAAMVDLLAPIGAENETIIRIKGTGVLPANLRPSCGGPFETH